MNTTHHADPKDHCEICATLREGREAEVREAEQGKWRKCQLCANLGWIGDLRVGPIVVCKACRRGELMKLWIIHERRERNYVPECIELAS